MTALPPFTMAYLTSAPLDAPDAIRLAAKLGYDGLGLRIASPMPGGHVTPLMQQPELLAETKAVLKGSGITVADVEIIRITPDFDARAHKRFLDVCAELGATGILAVSNDPDEERLAEHFAKLCDAAAPAGISINLEFMSFTAVKSASAALRIVTAAGRANGAVLVDTLHAARTATSLADLAAIPRKHLQYYQICDAPAQIPPTEEGIIHTARSARLLPGEGGLDLKAYVRAMPADLPVSIELPHDVSKASLGTEEWARRALAAAKRVVSEARG